MSMITLYAPKSGIDPGMVHVDAGTEAAKLWADKGYTADPPKSESAKTENAAKAEAEASASVKRKR